MSTAVEAVGFIMCIISWLVNGAALVNDYWKVSTVSGSVIISQRQFENLWHACAENSAGIAECRDFESMLALPGKTGHSSPPLTYLELRGDFPSHKAIKVSYLCKALVTGCLENRPACRVAAFQN
uniref:Claudin n=1 Tax=Neolamprologus brichardi TaxID=32507 RepID=A0A3Q4I5E8_NEOBR